MPRDRLRPADLAREHGLSAQAVRNYEEAGILPPAPRGPQGYRRYTPLHAEALRAFLALRPGYGHQVATEIMRAANAGDEEMLFRLVDQGHLESVRDRRTLDEVARALGDLTTDESPEPNDPGPLTIGALAHRLDVHPATLRKWEKAGIVHPYRDSATGFRLFAPETVRDARLAHQLRRGGYLLDQIAAVVAQVRSAGGTAALEDALRGWRLQLHQRNRARLEGAGRLDSYLRLLETAKAANDATDSQTTNSH